MKKEADKFATFVDHPRFGRRPRITGLNPHPRDHGVQLHWNAITLQETITQYEAAVGKWPYGHLVSQTERTKRIANTAVVADLTRQSRATVPVTHYFDLERRCLDCGKEFIFFAAEQKHWFETLQFPLEADAVRCPICRKQNQALGKARATYEQLQKASSRTEDDTVKLAEVLLTLIENNIFGARKTEHVRTLMKKLPDEVRTRLLKRVKQIEEKAGTANNPMHRTACRGM